jgi:hypothetical protein
MKLFYRKVECNFREFISAYLACSVGFATSEQALGLAMTLITQHLLGTTLSEEQRSQIVRDTNGQCMVELSFDEFMNLPTPVLLNKGART